ncbi:GNAT family N-acetyltransferase [Comamonas testosteroni]|uniref:GNAT family N-acetyltransferase n=1 Tax=Comamonas testosteroni TaxID=285 RepID=UPI003AF400B1
MEFGKVMAGSVGYTLTNSGDTAECGRFVRKQFLGRNLATIAVAKMKSELLEKNVRYLTASAKRQNIRSIRVAEKCGITLARETEERLF